MYIYISVAPAPLVATRATLKPVDKKVLIKSAAHLEQRTKNATDFDEHRCR